MTKDEAEAIRLLATQLLEEDVSVETRCRLARKIITHARAISASCMAEPATSVYGLEREVRNVTWDKPKFTYEFGTNIPPSPVVLTRAQAREQIAEMWDAAVTPQVEARQQAQSSLYWRAGADGVVREVSIHPIIPGT